MSTRRASHRASPRASHHRASYHPSEAQEHWATGRLYPCRGSKTPRTPRRSGPAGCSRAGPLRRSRQAPSSTLLMCTGGEVRQHSSCASPCRIPASSWANRPPGWGGRSLVGLRCACTCVSMRSADLQTQARMQAFAEHMRVHAQGVLHPEERCRTCHPSDPVPHLIMPCL